MTEAQYLKYIGEKINNEKEEVSMLSVARLVLAYNKRYMDEKLVKDFENSEKEIYENLIKRPELFSSKDIKHFDSLIELCDDEIKKAFSLGKTPQQGLLNVHTFVAELEAVDKKENIRQSRNFSDKIDKTEAVKGDYLFSKEFFVRQNTLIYDDEKFTNFYNKRKLPVAKEDLRKQMEILNAKDNEKFIDFENQYFARVVDEVIIDDNRIKCEANDTRNFA